MRAFMYKVLSFVKHLFLRLRVAVTLHIGREGIKTEEDNESNEEDSEKEDLL